MKPSNKANIDYDVLIAGAGPGGVTCALSLAKKGIRVGLVDKAEFPRDKICGDAISGKVVEVLKSLGISHYKALTDFAPKLGSWGVRFVAPNTLPLDVPFRLKKEENEPAPGFISKRMDFDNFMVDRIKETKGVDLIENYSVGEIEQNDEFIKVTPASNNQDVIRTKLLIGADGAHSIVAKKMNGFKVEPYHYCAGIRAYYENVSQIHKENFIELHFLKEFLPGYFWIFPLPNNQVNIGVGMLSSVVSKKRINLKESMLKIINENPTIAPRFKNAKHIGTIQGFGLPLGSKKRVISGNRFMLIGDAASLIDPFTGEGIGNAMISGQLAAEQASRCISSGDFSAASINQYDKEVYKRLWSELRLSRIMQKLLKYPWLFNLVVRKANANKALRETISGMFEDVDLRKKLGKPSFYMKLIFNS